MNTPLLLKIGSFYNSPRVLMFLNPFRRSPGLAVVLVICIAKNFI